MNNKCVQIALFTLTSVCLLAQGCGKYVYEHARGGRFSALQDSNSSNNTSPENSSEQDSVSSYPKRREASKRDLSLRATAQRPVVGLAQNGLYDTPVVMPGTVSDPDVQFSVYRCPANVTIQGVLDTFDEFSDKLNEPNSAREYFRANKFWTDIELKCTEVSKAHPQIELPDISAPSGDWRWFVRQCLPEGSSSLPFCSDVVAASPALLGFRSSLTSEHSELLVRINNKLSMIRHLSASFPTRAASMDEAYSQCSVADWEKAKRLLKRSIIANVVGYGSSILIGIFAPNAHTPASGSWGNRVRLIWEPTVDVQLRAQAITRVLLWLFTNKNDFKETCAAAEEIRISAAADLFKVKELQLSLAGDLDHAQRVGLKIPEGFIP